MHLAIDAVGQKQWGVATVLQDVLEAAVACDLLSRVTVFCSPRRVRTFDLPRSDKLEEVEEPLAENILVRHFWYERLLPQKVSRLRPDALLCLHSAGLSPQGVPHVTFVQRPLAYSPEARAQIPLPHRYRLPFILPAIKRSCRSARRVLVQSPTMRHSVADVCGVPLERIEVIQPAPRDLPARDEPAPELEVMRETPPDRRLLVVGQLVRHKNVDVVVAALSAVRERLPGTKLFLTSPPNPRYAGVLGVEYLGFPPDDVLRQAYELATVLVMPSLHETLGFPMLEAMRYGAPVAAADRPYAHDACDGAALYFDPLSARSLQQAIELLCTDKVRREELRIRGRGLIERRLAARPYERMIMSTVEAAGLLSERAPAAR